MHLDKLIGTDDITGIFRSYVDEPADEASDFEDAEVLDYINMEQRHLFSSIRDFDDNWQARKFVVPLVAGTYEYFLPMDCVIIKRVEIIKATAVTGVSPNYIVDEATACAQAVVPITMAQKGGILSYSGRGAFFRTGYSLYDEKIVLEPNGSITSTYYLRIYYLPQSPDLHLGYTVSATSSTMVLALSSTATTLGKVSPIDNFYQGMRVEIISGTGEGQLKRITKYDGATRTITIDVDWTTTPDATSRYSIVSPIQEDYQELLALGAVIRAKGIKVEDDPSGAVAVYEALKADMDKILYRRNKQTSRRVNSRRGDESWY